MKVEKQAGNLFKGLLFSIIAGGEFFLVEAYEHNPFVEVRSQAVLFNILLLELVAWLLFFVIGRARIAIWIETLAVMVFGLTNHYVMEFRSTPFVPWDLFSIGTAASVAGEYKFTFPARVILVTIGFLFIAVVAFFFQFEFRKKYLFRVICSLAVFVGLSVFVTNLQDEDFQTSHYLYPFLFTPAYMTKVNGMLVTFTMNLAYIVIDKPSGYSAKEAKASLASYAVEETVDQEELPNIIVIMDEAFSDLGVLGNLLTNEDYMPYVHSLQDGAENTVTGYLNVSVCGGNTANTEFEFLTGNSMAFLPNGSIPYQQYIKGEKASLASYLSDLGYETYAFHPYGASGWNRNEVYPYLGFDQSYFISDLQVAKNIRKYVSDETDFEKVIDIYQNKSKDKPAFIFNVTMQNHGSYTDAFENFTPDVDVLESNSFALEQYLSLLKVTDTDLKNFIHYFANQKEKTIIVFFGDHQPADSVASAAMASYGARLSDMGEEQLYTRYQVPYLIWANYDIEEGQDQETSANYLAAEVLTRGGVPVSDYMNYLLELKEEYPIISSVRVQKADGNETSAKNEKEGLLTYQKLQYYEMFDWEGNK